MKPDSDIWMRLLVALIEAGTGCVLGPLVRRVIMKASYKAKGNKGMLTFFGSFANAAIIIIACIIALDQLGVKMTVIVGAISAIGLGLSLALKDNMANVAGGLQILMTRPFSIGDRIQIGQMSGIVKEIDLMFTVLQTPGNKNAIIPNNTLVTENLINCTTEQMRRIHMTIEVEKYDLLEQTEKQMLDLFKAESLVLKDPAPSTQIKKLNPSYIQVELYAWCKTENYEVCRNNLTHAAASLYNKNAASPSDIAIVSEPEPAVPSTETGEGTAAQAVSSSGQ